MRKTSKRSRAVSTASNPEALMDVRKHHRGGGKLTRSETVTVRLDPRVRYLAELAARKQRRTLSSFIEWAVEVSLRDVTLSQADDDRRSIATVANELWDVDEADRFAKLALKYPDLLTHNEQILWKFIRQCQYFWDDHQDKSAHKLSAKERLPILERLRKHWDYLIRTARGEELDLPEDLFESGLTVPAFGKEKD